MGLLIPFRVVSWNRIDLANIRHEDVNVSDIACALSKICRFTGHIREFYSVAQHALMVAELVQPRLKYAALHHDDSEAYLGDVSRHLKHSEFLSGYRVLEERAQTIIEHVMGIELNDEDRQHIKAADDCLAVFEQYVLRQSKSWLGATHILEATQEGFIRGANIEATLAMATKIPSTWQPFIALNPSQAERLFLSRHEEWS
jgi:hypothetical protein